MYLEHFVPKVLEIRHRWFPQCGIPSEAIQFLPPSFAGLDLQGSVDVMSWCDPAGQTNNSGSRVTAVTALHNFGIYPRSPANGNAAPERYAAIQSIAGMMLRAARNSGRSFVVNPRCLEVRRSRAGKWTETAAPLVVDAMSLGYVWDDKAAPDNNPNVRRPKKNHRGDKFSHLMNGLEYVVLGEGLVHRPNDKQRARAGARLRAAGEAMAAHLNRTPADIERENYAEQERQLRKLLRSYKDTDPDDTAPRRGGRVRYSGYSLGLRAGYP